MVEKPIPLHAGPEDHGIGHRERITVFPEKVSRETDDDAGDESRFVFVSIGPGETRVSVIDGEGRSVMSWTAIFGWSSLCRIQIRHDGVQFNITDIDRITKALRGVYRRYGAIVDTSDFRKRSESDFRKAISDILDQTIGDASEYDRIIFAAPEGLHGVLGDSLELRPHIDSVIQVL